METPEDERVEAGPVTTSLMQIMQRLTTWMEEVNARVEHAAAEAREKPLPPMPETDQMRDAWTKMGSEIQSKIKEREAKVREEQAQAIVPPEELRVMESRLEEKYAEVARLRGLAIERSLDLDRREMELNDLVRKLELKSDTLGKRVSALESREQRLRAQMEENRIVANSLTLRKAELDEREQKLDVRATNIEAQEDSIEVRYKTLADKTKECGAARYLIDLRESKLNARDMELNQRQQKLNDRSETMEKQAKATADDHERQKGIAKYLSNRRLELDERERKHDVRVLACYEKEQKNATDVIDIANAKEKIAEDQAALDTRMKSLEEREGIFRATQALRDHEERKRDKSQLVGWIEGDILHIRGILPSLVMRQKEETPSTD